MIDYQYTKDKSGKLGVFIPMKEWERVRDQLVDDDEIPEWHIKKLERREKLLESGEMENYDIKIVMDKLDKIGNV
jgi:hypothetical protein